MTVAGYQGRRQCPKSRWCARREDSNKSKESVAKEADSGKPNHC